SSEPCCDSCRCTKSIPPQCHCANIRLFCYKPCESM
nr:Chain I, PROTEIN (MUNG BEAN INHIBITOR LYSIN ACTIVE FRAGMENT) [Vigna radiata]